MQREGLLKAPTVMIPLYAFYNVTTKTRETLDFVRSMNI